jgi:hypothetical protein
VATDWAAIENALQALVKAGSGFDNRHAYWGGPNVSRPTDGQPFAVLELLTRVPVGCAPEIVQTDDLGRPQGQEVELSATQMVACGFRVSVFAPPARGAHPGVPRGTSAASNIAEGIRLAAALPSQVANLDAAGVGVFDLGQVQDVPAIAGADFEGRAVLDARIYVSSSVSEFTGYIASVETAGTIQDPDGTTEALPTQIITVT